MVDGAWLVERNFMIDILVVEDNKELSDVIEQLLLHSGYRIQCVGNGKDALAYLSSTTPKLLLVDIMLPDMEGFHICEEVRKTQGIPIIIMSARTQTSDVLQGYDIGADDYIEKPFKMPVLLAKIKALLKRTYEQMGQAQVLLDGDLSIDESRRIVTLKKQHISLSTKEYELLVLLIQHKGKTLSKEFLFNTIWGVYSESELSTLTVHINTLREKIEKDARHPKRLLTVWGVGYRYEGME